MSWCRGAALSIVVLSTLIASSCGDHKETQTESKLAGTRLGNALSEQLAASTAVELPFRCARPESMAAPAVEVAPTAPRVSLVAVSGLRELNQQTRATLEALSRLVRNAKPTAVLSLGGHSASEALVDALLDAVGSDSWPVVVIPGASDSQPLYRRAVAKSKAKGFHIIDGTIDRTIAIGPLTLLTLPGADTAERLMAAANGCRFEERDLGALLTASEAAPPIRIIAAAIPPRQQGETGTDLVDGIHIGSLSFAAALAAHPGAVELIVHGLSGAPATATVTPGRGHSPRFAATGTLDPGASAALEMQPKGPGALLLEATKNELRFRPLFPPVP